MPERQSQRPSCSPSRVAAPRPARVSIGALLGAALLLACAGAAPSSNDRYPEEKHPETPVSASDGEVLGAHEQDPSDTLEGSLTNEHAAPGSPHAEEPAKAAHERLEQDECIEATKAAAMPGDEVRKKPICPPRPRAE